MGHGGSKEDLEFLNLAGKGFFGEVYKAKYKGSKVKKGQYGEFVAVKQIDKNLVREMRRDLRTLGVCFSPQ